MKAPQIMFDKIIYRWLLEAANCKGGWFLKNKCDNRFPQSSQRTRELSPAFMVSE
jgi:hypothetical protein